MRPFILLVLLLGALSAAEGDVDPSFASDGVHPLPELSVSDDEQYFLGTRKLAVHPDGSLLVAGAKDGRWTVAALAGDGVIRSDFGVDGFATIADWSASAPTSIVIGVDAAIVTAGWRQTSRGRHATAVGLLHDGTRSPDFGIDGVVADRFATSSRSDGYLALRRRPAGELVFSGFYGTTQGHDVLSRRVTPSGESISLGSSTWISMDAAIAGWRHDFAIASAFDADGRVVFVGNSWAGFGELTSYSAVAGRRYVSGDRRVDTIFGEGGVWEIPLGVGEQQDRLVSAEVDGSGAFTAVGWVDSPGGRDAIVLRSNGNAELDADFGDAGIVRLDLGPGLHQAHDLIGLPEGGYLVAGGTLVDPADPASEQPFVARLQADGSPDIAFGPDGIRVLPVAAMRRAEGLGLAPLRDRLYVHGRAHDGTSVVAALELTEPGRRISLSPMVTSAVQSETVSVTAHLVDESGAPLAGESVEFTVHGPVNGGASFPPTTTDAAGRAVLSLTCEAITRDTSEWVSVTYDDHGIRRTAPASHVRWLVNEPAGSLPVVVTRSTVVPTDPGLPYATVQPEAIDGGSSHPDGLDLTFGIEPVGPYPVGDNAVHLVVVDSAGAIVRAPATITVEDREPPTFSPLLPRELDTLAGQDYALSSSLPGPRVGDNVGVADLGHDAGDQLGIGTTEVTWTAADAAGNPATIVQAVTVVDREAPRIEPPPVQVIPPDPGSRQATGVTLDPPPATDNDSVAGLTSDVPDVYEAGWNLVTWVATDPSGNATTALQSVFVGEADARTPALAFVAPASGGHFAVGFPLHLSVEVADLDPGDVERVVFLVGGVEVAVDEDAPYTAIWTPPSGGQIELHARIEVFSLESAVLSDPITVEVVE